MAERKAVAADRRKAATRFRKQPYDPKSGLTIAEHREAEKARLSKQKERYKKLVCDRLVAGDLLTVMCKDPDMPSKDTVYSWMAEDAEFEESYFRARRIQVDQLAEEILKIADASEADMVIDASGRKKISGHTVHRARLQVEARFKLMEKLNPERYGQKVQIRGSGEGGAFELDFKLAPRRGGKTIQMARRRVKGSDGGDEESFSGGKAKMIPVDG